MPIDELWLQSVLALVGGAAAELVHWYALARKPGGIERFRKKPLYLGTTLLMIAFGGLMPVLYNSGAASALLCFHLGATTPLLLQKLVTTVPVVAEPMGVNAGRPSLREFFRW